MKKDRETAEAIEIKITAILKMIDDIRERKDFEAEYALLKKVLELLKGE